MKQAEVWNVARERVVGSRVGVADGWWSRLRGLLGRPALQKGEGLLLVPCNAVHMLGMKYPLDVAFLDREGVVVALYSHLPPGGRTRRHRQARSALELPVGTLAATGTREGDVLSWTILDGSEPGAPVLPARYSKAKS
jgi:uncharacterized protein